MTMRSDFEAQLVSKDPDAATALKWFPEIGRYYSMWIQASWEGFQLGYKAGVDNMKEKVNVILVRNIAVNCNCKVCTELSEIAETIRQLGGE